MLELQSIVKAWQPPHGKARPLLRGVSVSVAAGETVALLGSSGSGKSTLLRIAAGLEAADAGSVCMDGQEITGLPPSAGALP